MCFKRDFCSVAFIAQLYWERKWGTIEHVLYINTDFYLWFQLYSLVKKNCNGKILARPLDSLICKIVGLVDGWCIYIYHI